MKYRQRNNNYYAKRALTAVSAVILLFNCPLDIYAAGISPQFSRAEEEWAKLEDNTLTWVEIDDLVSEYNPTVRINAAYYTSDALQAKNNRQVSETLLHMADRYDALADSYDSGEDAAQSAQYRLQAEQLRQEADENVSDSEVLYLENLKTEKGIALQVKQLFVQYYKDFSEKTKTEESIGYLEKFYKNKNELYQAGKSDEIDALKALETLQQEKAGLISLEAAVETDYRKLITQCGWEYTSEVEIGTFPQYSKAEIMGVNAEEDLSKTVENSLTLQIDEKKKKNSESLNDASITEKWARQKKTDENNVKAAYQKAYTALLSAGAAFDNTLSSYELKEKSYTLAEKKKALGRMTEMGVLELEKELKAAEGEKRAAWYDLILARISYDAVVNGYTED